MGLSILRREKEFRPITTTTMSSLLRSAIWAMTNVIYGGRIGLSGTSFSSSIPNSITTTSTTCSFRYVDRVWALNNIPLTREDAATLLLSCTCTELVNETCLLLLSLTREWSMINYYLDDDI